MTNPVTPAPEEQRVGGKAIVIPIALVLVAAIGITVLYKTTQPSHGMMAFERVNDAGNETVQPLNFKAVHAALFLEDHLTHAAETGGSQETVQLRIESMRETLGNLTGFQGPTWLVGWEGTLIRISA